MQERGELDVGFGKKFAVEECWLCFLECTLEALEAGESVGAVVYVGVWGWELLKERMKTSEHPAWVC